MDQDEPQYDLDEVSHSVNGIPPTHHHCTLENFDWSGEGQEKKVRFQEILVAMQKYLKTGQGSLPNLLLIGKPGNGKTHLSVALWRWAVLRTNARSATWIHVPDFVQDVKDSYSRSYDPMDQIRDADFFVAFDDLFGVDLSEHEEGILSRAINTAYQNEACIVATTNYRLDKIQAKIHEHEISRLLKNGVIWEFEGEDRRL